MVLGGQCTTALKPSHIIQPRFFNQDIDGLRCRGVPTMDLYKPGCPQISHHRYRTLTMRAWLQILALTTKMDVEHSGKWPGSRGSSHQPFGRPHVARPVWAAPLARPTGTRHHTWTEGPALGGERARSPVRTPSKYAAISGLKSGLVLQCWLSVGNQSRQAGFQPSLPSGLKCCCFQRGSLVLPTWQLGTPLATGALVARDNPETHPPPK